MADRKSEIEAKKQKLAEMRAKRLHSQVPSTISTKGPAIGPAVSESHEDIIKQVLDILPSVNNSTSGAVSTLNVAGSRLSQIPNPAPVKSKASVKLTQHTVDMVDIAPLERNCYSKDTQTMFESGSREMLNFEDADHDVDSNATLAELHKIGVMQKSVVCGDKEMNTSLNAGVNGTEDPVRGVVDPGGGGGGGTQIPGISPGTQPRILTEEESAHIMMNENFQRFFDHTMRVIERAINEPLPDLFTDYTGDEEGDLQHNRGRDMIKQYRVFQQNSSQNRSGIACTDLHWSPIFPELLAASYSTQADLMKDADGRVLIWNVKYRKDSPEFSLNSQSAVLSVCFAPFHPKLVLGATYSGQVVMWDLRSNKCCPVQRSQVGNQAHTHPIYCLTVQGTQHAHNLLSVSTDGLLCSWSLDTLSQPADRLELSTRQVRGVAATCMDFFTSDVNNFVLGCEDGSMFTGCRHGNKAGLTDAYEGHMGPITGISTHSLPVTTIGGVGSLFLSSSVDWSVKLWTGRLSVNQSGSAGFGGINVAGVAGTGGVGGGSGATGGGSSTIAGGGGGGADPGTVSYVSAVVAGASGVGSGGNSGVGMGSLPSKKSIHTFNNFFGYVMDVKWSTTHPALFSTVDGEGVVQLWNLNEDVEVPIAEISNDSRQAINKCQWHSSGTYLACGDIDGRVLIYNVNEQLSVPGPDEVSNLALTINNLSQSNA